MRETTESCRQLGHPELEAEVDHPEWFEAELVDFITAQADAVRRGVRFAPGYDLVVGWMVLNLTSLPNGNLGHAEPDFRSMPIRWVQRLDRCFEHVRVHSKLLESLGLEHPSFARLDFAAVSGKDFLSAKAFRLHRETPEQAHDSGWVFEPLRPTLDYEEDPKGTLVFQSLYETALIRPEIVPFMCLPVGAEVEVDAARNLRISLAGDDSRLKLGTSLQDYLPRKID
jgi:hypothetical protein